MTFKYTPPEPIYITLRGDFESSAYFTEAQLRAEVERVRRETIEACAKEIERVEASPNPIINMAHKLTAAAIRSLK